MRKFMLIAIPIILVACAACDPAVPTLPPKPVTQTDYTIHFEGDSVSTLTYYNQGITGFWTSAEFVPGSSAAFNPAGEPAMDRVPRMVAAGKVATLVWALGPNDIRLAHGQWSVKDQWIWYDVLANKVPSTSCIVIIKPWVLPSGWAVFPEQALTALSSWIDKFAQDHPNVVVEDWRPIIEAHPEYMADDGVHIATHDAAVARDSLARTGIANCVTP